MMTFVNRRDLREFLDGSDKRGKSVGFVPTMGALHAGHLSLLRRSVSENDITVLSIFVNPTQFNNPEDLAKYPRTLERDLELVATVSPDIVAFAPDVHEMYGENPVAKHYDFHGLESQMEGRFRPGHFDGVGTIVSRLFEIVKPARAYFGEKDFQQLQIIRKLVEIEHIPVEIVECPILREDNGLAMSSRNERLSPELREDSAFIYQTLKAAREKAGSETPDGLRSLVKAAFKDHPTLELEYFEVADSQTLEPASTFEPGRHYRGFIAVMAAGVRLIDTISFN